MYTEHCALLSMANSHVVRKMLRGPRTDTVFSSLIENVGKLD